MWATGRWYTPVHVSSPGYYQLTDSFCSFTHLCVVIHPSQLSEACIIEEGVKVVHSSAGHGCHIRSGAELDFCVIGIVFS